MCALTPPYGKVYCSTKSVLCPTYSPKTLHCFLQIKSQCLTMSQKIDMPLPLFVLPFLNKPSPCHYNVFVQTALCFQILIPKCDLSCPSKLVPRHSPLHPLFSFLIEPVTIRRCSWPVGDLVYHLSIPSRAQVPQREIVSFVHCSFPALGRSWPIRAQ